MHYCPIGKTFALVLVFLGAGCGDGGSGGGYGGSVNGCGGDAGGGVGVFGGSGGDGCCMCCSSTKAQNDSLWRAALAYHTNISISVGVGVNVPSCDSGGG